MAVQGNITKCHNDHLARKLHMQRKINQIRQWFQTELKETEDVQVADQVEEQVRGKVRDKEAAEVPTSIRRQ